VSEPVLVTGVASGIGSATAISLAAAGVPVIGTDLRGDGPGDIDDVIACDLTDPQAIDGLIAALPETLGGVACVAGVPGTAPPETVVRVNLLAARRLGAGLIPRVVAGGAIVHVASVAQFRSPVPADEAKSLLALEDADVLGWLERRGLDGTQAYDFSKQALVALARLHAAAGLPSGVRVLSVSPGPVETPILDDFKTTMGADRMDAAARVVGRHGRTDDVAPVIAFLLSEQARWVNAIDVLVDGGLIGVR
jgi:NAD(P)-dependent dehydrogenase (short-subunit alcohol dehydrogenase family)